MPSLDTSPLSLAEVFGLTNPSQRLREAMLMLRGDPHTPASRFDTTSLKILHPRLSLSTWLGLKRKDGLIPIYNLFNHTPTPVEEGWSVRVTRVTDYRGKERTYDSHNGTDFAIPVGTIVVAPAPGRVVRVSNEFHRGGLKVVIDHGRGLITTSNHLGRALVTPGQMVTRAQPIALAGGSGVDMLAAFPWSAPHVHFNTWLNGLPIDPFACESTDEASIWRVYNDPKPYQGDLPDEEVEPTEWDEDALSAAIDACIDPALRRHLRALRGTDFRAAATIFHINYFPTRFPLKPMIYAKTFEREPRLDLPFRAEDFRGIIHREHI